MTVDYRQIDGRFPTTHWSLVVQVGLPDAEARREALGRLLERYLPALRAHLLWGKRLPPEEADDVLQDFVAGKIIERGLIGRADAALGKFRTFLLAALDRFLIDHFRQRNAKKRSPDGIPLEIGEHGDLLPSPPQPSDAFDVAWARSVLAEALRRMRAECEASGRADVWGVFQCRLLDPSLQGTEPIDYEQLVARFGLQSPSQASNVLITAKRMFARALRSVVGEYAMREEEIDAEIRELREILGSIRE
jgi:DNA-directed RNA polymerase specialized sigma24 family protein